MFYDNWLEYIKDDALITKVAIPGAHNSGTKGMNYTACCQDGTPFDQYRFGVRKFGIRLSQKKNKLYIAHGIMKGMSADEAFSYFGEIVTNFNDFFILDVRAYQKQTIGPFTLSNTSDPELVDELIEKYLEPEKYALTDIPDLKALTLGDIRKSGKKYVIHHAEEVYKYSRDIKLLEPWDPVVFGLKPEKFAKESLNYLRELESEGFFWFQSQQTPNLGTENGLKWPRALDEEDRIYFPQMITDIAEDPILLDKVNIIAGDFMTRDHMKTNYILWLNLLKDIVKPGLRDEYADAIGKRI
ncbi:MAG: hypothetical protein IK097_00930 [Clostridia bacterium]|nr:hypothetical protein [Clostridia bacterium]